MPLYEFENLESGEIKSFFFSCKDVPSLGSISEIDSESWKRIMIQAPYGAVDGKSTDPYNPQAFVERSGKKKGTMGNLFDESAELSAKRAKQSNNGRDPLKDKWFDNWSKTRGNKKHPADDRR